MKYIFVIHTLNTTYESIPKFQSKEFPYFIFIGFMIIPPFVSSPVAPSAVFDEQSVRRVHLCRDKWGSDPTFFLFLLYFPFLSHELYLDNVCV